MDRRGQSHPRHRREEAPRWQGATAGVTAVGLALLTLAGLSAPAGAQQPAPRVDPALFDGLEYRMIGPARGGRVQAVAGHRDRPFTFYMGATGGGIWKTTNAGQDWRPVTDGFLEAGSIGSIDVADSDPDVVYAGTGEVDIRGNASAGRGVYRSTDAGETWKLLGLTDAGQIADVVVHPEDSDVAWVAALGHAFGKNEERGVYRTTDGGRSWRRVLYLNDSTGVADLAAVPGRPDVLYAGAWSVEREPWALRSGTSVEAGGGVWKTTDGGETWTQLAGGLPTGQVGKVGVAVSRPDPERVWAIVEAPRPHGAVYRSDDGGRSWEKVGTDPRLQQRPFYYHHVYAHPTDPHTVYVVGEDFWVSHDGGETYEEIPVPHGDNHGLWIHPDRPEIMVEANDGGANVSLDGGESWSTQLNQPTAQFYRVEVDDGFPYRVYGAQQDNTTISVPAWTDRGVTPQANWYAVGGCESGHIAVDPRNRKRVYAGCYHGEIERANLATGRRVEVIPYAQAQEGQAAKELEYRFQWNAPIEIDPHDPDVVYHTSQVVHRTRDGGRSWEVISPDLTHDDTSKQDFPEPTVTRDLTGVEVYNTIFTLTPSPHEEGVLWAGTDDGRVWITRSGGGGRDAWSEVTPEGLPRWSTVNAIEVSPHDAGTAYVTAYRYRLDDFRPYVFRTGDYGESWTRIADGSRGIPPDHPTRVVREDPDRQGLLYAGTEFGMYVSFDDGGRWQPLQLDLPTVPITDLAVHRKDLVVATQGRSFWILDNLTPLHQLDGEYLNRARREGAALYAPRDAYRVDPRGYRGPAAPEYPPAGVALDYYLEREPDEEVTLEILEPDGDVVRRFTSDSARAAGAPGPSGVLSGKRLPSSAGMHRFVWNLRYPGVNETPDAIVWGYLGGPVAVPGEYRARLAVGDWRRTRTFRVRMDPRWEELTVGDLRRQFEFELALRDTLDALYSAVRAIRDVREQASSSPERLEDAGVDSATVASVRPRVDSLVAELTEVEGRLTQTKNRARFDFANYPPALDTEFAYVYMSSAGHDAAPPEGVRRRWRDLLPAWRRQHRRLGRLLEERVPALNRALREAGLPPVTGAGGR